MNGSDFKIIYWNIWLELQNGKRDQRPLLQKFRELIDAYNPDYFGLNEVVVRTKTNESDVIKLLKQAGYHVHFVPFSNISDDLVVGSALASKLKPLTIKNVSLGPDTQAQRRGFPNQQVSLIHGEFKLGNKPLTITANYLGNLIPLDWGTHVTHRKNFNAYLHNLKSTNVVIGGDFNEPKYLWPWLTMPTRFSRRTGNLTNPTWKLLGKKFSPLQANYDYILHTNDSQLKLNEFRVLNRYPSDHSPLIASFSLS